MLKTALSPLVALLFAALLCAPSMIYVQFKLDQSRIARELCVQREVMEDMRTCHGECQLSKRFKALEARAEAGFPAELIEMRQEPAVAHAVAPRAYIAPVADLAVPDPCYHTAAGYPAAVDHVPWA